MDNGQRLTAAVANRLVAELPEQREDRVKTAGRPRTMGPCESIQLRIPVELAAWAAAQAAAGGVSRSEIVRRAIVAYRETKS